MVNQFNRFGNMNPPAEMNRRHYLMAEDPFKIVGNTYYVGNSACASYLIDTGEGLILLDTPFLSQLGYLLSNIWKLGHDPKEIKYIIVSHAHHDHYGSVKALVYLTGAKTCMSRMDIESIKNNPQMFEEMHQEMGNREAELFDADIALEDHQHIGLGNVDIECVLTPGHTIGTMSHFWKTSENGITYDVGIYGGAGFITLSDHFMQHFGLPMSLRQDFLKSIEKVWDRKVDVMLGNHPFHADIFDKKARFDRGDSNAFVDPDEWHRFLTELRTCYLEFMEQTPEEARKMYEKSSFLTYRGKAIPFLEHTSLD